MHHLSDKDLDRLSKDAAEHYDVDQNTSGWEKLELSLNKVLPRGGKDKRRILFFLLFFVLLSGSGLIWIISGNKGPDNSSEVTTPAKPVTAKKSAGDIPASGTAEKLLEESSKPEPGENTTGKSSKQPVLVTNKNDGPIEPVVPGKSAKQIANANKQLKSNSAHFTRKSSREKKLTTVAPVSINSDTEKNRRELQINPDKSDKKNNANPTEPNITDSKIDKSNPVKTNPVSADEKSVQKDLTQADQVSATKNIPTQEKKVPSKQKNNFVKNKLTIGLVAGPDFSNVRFVGSDKTGLNVGISVDFRLSDRWSLNTGIIYTRKNYNARGKDFHPPKNTWPNTYYLHSVEGNCSMYDFPLNVRFNVTRSKNKLFASAGFSTYLMNKENYGYHYTSYGIYGWGEKTYKSNDVHLLSIMNFSIGFEKQINKRLSLQAEPYLKIPVSGIGYGRMQLNSSGGYISVRYGIK